MKKLLLVAFSLVAMSFSGHSQAYEEVSCSAYGANANSCDQCFDGGSKYVGDVFRPNDVFNAWSNDRLYFDDENPVVYSFQSLNANTSWFVSDNLLQYPDSFVWNTYQDRYVHLFNAGTSERFLETQPGKGIRLQSVATDTVSPNEPAFKFTFISNYRTYDGSIGELEEHTECIFYKPNYCGDGILDTSNGETCDPSDPDATGHGTGGCDTNTCQPIEAPTCNALTVTPVSGENPLTSTVTCEGYKVNTFEIDCGNGDTPLTGNGSGIGTQQFNHTCTYTEEGSFTPVCTINGTITNNSCQGNVQVKNPTPSITIDKRDANTADLDGNVGNDTQTVENGALAAFRITVTNNGGEGLTNVSVSDANAPACVLTEAQALTKIQNAWNGDSIFDVGESFTYVCSKANTTEDYTNIAGVVGTWVISGTVLPEVTDPTEVIVAKDFDLALIKTVVGNNTVFQAGSLIEYAITVYNQWDIDASGVVVTDYIPTGFTLEDSAWASAWSAASRNIGDVAAGTSKQVTIKLRVGNNVSGSVINWAEISRDDISGDYTDIDSTPDTNNNNDCHGGLGRGSVSPSNDNRLNGTGDVNNNGRCDSNEDEDDHDPAVVVISDAQISIVKTDANTADLDGNVGGNDRQTVSEGAEAVFKITVTNTGSDDLNNIVLTDAVAPNCAGSVTLPGTYPSTWSNFTTTATGNVLKSGESFSYTCIKSNTTENYTNIADVNADSVVTGDPVTEDSDPTQVLVELPFDLALTKTVSSNSGTNFEPGDIVTFDITVINQGSVNATNVVITDYIPSALELADNAWTAAGSNATRNVGTITEGQTKMFSINLRVRDNANEGSVINWAEISAADGGTDIDSTPDSDNNNDCHGGLPRNQVDPNSDDRTNGTGDANGNGTCNSGEDEDDHDPAVITISTPVFDLALTKEVTGWTTSFSAGDIIPFAITVVNQGSVNATNVVVTDYIPTGLELADANWTLSAGNATRTIASLPAGQSVTLSLNLRVKADATGGNTINWAEISAADGGTDIDSTPDANNNNDCHGGLGRDQVSPVNDDRLDGTGDTNGNGNCDSGEDEDDHDPALVTIVPGVFDLALTKEIRNLADGYLPGDIVTYQVTVYNQGTVDATNVEVIDYIPAGLELADSSWTLSGTNAVYSLANIPADSSTAIALTLRVSDTAVAGDTINYAEISSAEGWDDCDSTPDSTNGNQTGETTETGMIDDDIGNGCNSGGDEDDHDLAVITVETTLPSIAIDKTDSNDLDQDTVVGNDTQTVANGTNSEFKITVTNNGTEDLDTITLVDANSPTCSGSVTLPGTYPSTWSDFTTTATGDVLKPGESFSYTCIRTNTTSTYTNSATVNALWVTSNTPVNATDTSPVIVPIVTGWSSSSSNGGGWSTYTCAGINVAGSRVTCTWNSRVQSYRLDCGNGQGINGTEFQYQSNSTKTRTATFTCNYDPENGWAVATWPAVCSVHSSDTENPNAAWRTRFACNTSVPMIAPQCGDGILQTSNNEQCERVVDADGNIGDFPSICTASCLLNIPTSSSSSSGGWTITIPNSGEINFYPEGKVILGDKMGVYDTFGAWTPTIVNNSDYDLNFDELCIVKKDTSKTSLDGSDLLCTPMGWVFYPGEEISFTETEVAGYKWNAGGIPAGDTFEDNTLVTTIKHEGNVFTNAYFAADLEVRVSKPTVVTVWGGTTYIADTSKIADTQEVADNGEFVNHTNRNFEWVSISEADALSSSTITATETTDAALVADVQAVEAVFEEAVQTIDTNTTGWGDNLIYGSDTLRNYNGIENVYVVSGWDNLTILAGANFDETATFVIEDGWNLTIEWDITTDSNIAFVLKGWNITVEKDVEVLKGTYITIGGTIGWEASQKQLVVNGSLYGDIQPLVNNRTYIKQDEVTGNLGVGTVVSFGSSIFKKPAPLVGQFVGEYLESSKVAN